MHFINILSLLLLATTFAVAVPPPKNEGRDLNSCDNNLALSALKLLRATKFCSDFLHISTQTATSLTTTTLTVPVTVSVTTTLTDAQTASATVTAVALTTSTVVADGPTSTVTTVSPTTTTITSTVIVSTSRTTTSIYTSYRRNGPLKRRALSESEIEKRLDIPGALLGFGENIISTACNCYVTAPTTSVTSTVTETAKPTETLSFTETVSPTLATVTATVLSTNYVTVTSTRPGVTTTATAITRFTTTTSMTTTRTSVITASSTILGETFTHVQSFSDNCVPYNYQSLISDVPASLTTYNDVFQYCATRCMNDPGNGGCDQLWVSSSNPTTGAGPYWCLYGAGGQLSNWHWVSSEIQCQYPPIPKYANWYSVVKGKIS